MKLKGQIPVESVDLDKTLGAQTSAFSRGEDEITMKAGKRVYVEYIEVGREKHLIGRWCVA